MQIFAERCLVVGFSPWNGRLSYIDSNVPSFLNFSLEAGFPCGSAGKESACNAGDLGSIPRLGRCPGGGHGNPLQYSYLENLHGQRSLADYSPWGRKELDTTEQLSLSLSSKMDVSKLRKRMMWYKAVCSMAAAQALHRNLLKNKRSISIPDLGDRAGHCNKFLSGICGDSSLVQCLKSNSHLRCWQISQLYTPTWQL